MVQPIIPQPITDMGYGGMDFLRKFRQNKRAISSPLFFSWYIVKLGNP